MYTLKKPFVFYLILLLGFSCKNTPNKKVEWAEGAEVHFLENGRPRSFFGESEFETEEADQFNLKGIDLVKQGKLFEAQTQFLNAFKIEPNNPIVLNNLGNIEHNFRNYSKAIEFFEASLEKSDSLYLNAALNLGLLYWKDYEFDKSIDVLEYVLEQSKSNFQIGTAHYQLARTFLDNNECSNSKSSYLKAKHALRDIEGFQTRLDNLYEEIKTCVQHRKLQK